MVGIYELQKLMNGNGFIEWLIVSLLSSLCLAVFNVLYFTKIFNVSTNKKKNILMIVLDALIRLVSSIFIAVPFYRILNIITTIILYKLIYKQNIEKSILGESVNTITIVCPEAIFSKLVCNMFNHIDTYFNGMYDFQYKAYLALAVILFRAVIYCILRIKKFNINIPNKMSDKNRISIIITTIIGIAILVFNSLEMSMYEVNFPFSILVLDIISLVIYFYFSIKNIIEITKIEEQDTKIESLESYNKTLGIMYDNIRGFRHDFGNIVQALKGYIDTQNYEGLERMSKSLMKECQDINNMGILDPNIIKNSAIYSVLTNKYHLAQEGDITINVQVEMDFKEIEQYTYELCRILGILLDNAIEAARDCENKIVNVKFIKDTKVNRNLIIVENTYNEIDIDVDKIFEKGYTSKQDTSKEHGLGLWNVRKMLNRLKCFNLFTTKSTLFCQQLEIYNE